MLFTGAGLEWKMLEYARELASLRSWRYCARANGFDGGAAISDWRRKKSAFSPFPSRFRSSFAKRSGWNFSPSSTFRQLRRLAVSLNTYALFQTTITVSDSGPGGKCSGVKFPSTEGQTPYRVSTLFSFSRTNFYRNSNDTLCTFMNVLGGQNQHS